MSVITILLEHLKKEDDKFYPVLYKAAEDNKDLKDVLDVFAMDMENVSSFAQEFVDKYSRGVLGKELHGEFKNIFVALCNRIRNEEDILYEVYEKMNQ